MRASHAVALGAGLVLLLLLLSSTLAPAMLPPAGLPARGSVAPSSLSAITPAPEHPSFASPIRVAPPAPTVGAPATIAPVPANPPHKSAGWNTSSFFDDAIVNFYGTGLTYGFREVPFVNAVPTTTLGFGVTVSAAAPLLFANVTIWGNQWPGTNLSTPIAGFSPMSPTIRPMLINASDPAQATFYFDNYRFFWPGSIVSFNITLVGKNSTPSEIKSASNVSVNENYPGGFTDAATWVYGVQSPWASANFSDDIEVSTTPNVLVPPIYAPNPTQTLTVSIQSVPVGSALPPIPAASLQFTVDINGSITSYSEPFGPPGHGQMTLVNPIGPYPGSTVNFTVTAWLPWEGGTVDRIQSSTVSFTWSPNGGWWHPLAGLLGNLEMFTSPTVGTASPVPPATLTTLPTDEPVTVTIHEPIENVTIASASAVYTYSDQGATRTGTLPMTALNDNTSSLTFPGLPPGARLSFYLEAKDLNGIALSSGSYGYVQAGPTDPALPAGRGLLFLECLDLSTGLLVPNFLYTVSNATWSTSGSSNYLAFATPLLPTSSIPDQLSFGAYHVSLHAFGVTQTATIAVSVDSPIPVVIFYGESQPLPAVPTGSVSPESIVAAGGLIAAAVITLPLVNWFSERRAKAEEEQRRITL